MKRFSTVKTMSRATSYTNHAEWKKVRFHFEKLTRSNNDQTSQAREGETFLIKMMRRAFNDVKKNWRRWEWWKARYRVRILSHLLGNKGIYIVDEEWDNLIILDACRYDTFRETNTIEGNLESRISRGSNTEDFLLENFMNYPQYYSFRDIVYVTANPFVDLLLPGKFYKIYSVWDYGWDDDLNTVHPAYVAKEGLKAHQKHLDKKLIIHFMQPHSPFLGTKLVGVTGFSRLRNAVSENRGRCRDVHWSDLVEKGKLDLKDVLFAYKKNLRIVLPYVKELIDRLPGRTVVTSDHGNLFGERPHILYPFKEFGHHMGLHVKQLVLIPWLIVDHGRTKIDAEKIKVRSKIRKLKTQGRI